MAMIVVNWAHRVIRGESGGACFCVVDTLWEKSGLGAVASKLKCRQGPRAPGVQYSTV